MRKRSKNSVSGPKRAAAVHFLLEFTLQKRYDKIISTNGGGWESKKIRMKGEHTHEFCTFGSGDSGPQHDADAV